MKQRIIISVTSDLSTDQRVHRAALTLHNKGYDVLLVGRLLKNSLGISDRPYSTHRFKLWFSKGALFYANYNLRLFFYLLVHNADILLANDLDTLLPNYLVSKLKNKQLVYDNHEYYTGVPELANRPLVRSIWKSIERWIFPKLKYVYTVNASIADLYKGEYNVPVSIVRNVPFSIAPAVLTKAKLRKDLGLPEDKFIVILQGNGINVDRGAEEAVLSMQFVEDTLLLIAGNGDVIDKLKTMVIDKKLEDKVVFKNRMPFAELVNYTRCADLGLTLDKNTNINYKFSLPNKLFDYIQCGVPVLASDLVEVKKIIQNYNIGTIVKTIFPLELAKAIHEIKGDDYKQQLWQTNLKKAATELNWENEQSELLAIFEKLSSDTKKKISN
jgi:glycosyltransferase involved in cell wall biosynthesis